MTRSEATELQEVREKLIRMEEQANHRASEQAEMKEKLDRVEKDIRTIKDLMMQAKGAKWAILGVAALAGALAAKGTAFIQFFTK